jgi:hypothetical protein
MEASLWIFQAAESELGSKFTVDFFLDYDAEKDLGLIIF